MIVMRACRQPAPREDTLLGFGYGQTLRLAETETVTPLAAPHAVITVADLLP